MKTVESIDKSQRLAGSLLCKCQQVRINVRIPNCPRIFPHQVTGDCEYCSQLYTEKETIILDTWEAARQHYAPPEAVPLKRRLNIAVTRLFNWIGSWLSN